MELLEEITHQLLEFAPDAMVVVDHRGVICFANNTIQTLFGHEPKTLIGRTVDALIPQRFHNQHHEYVDGYRHSPRNREMGGASGELFALRANGEEFPASIRLAPFQAGGQSFVAAAIRDITEQRQIHRALSLAQEEAMRANRAKSRFLATASHDLRQPIQAIRLINASLLKLATQDHGDLVNGQCEALLASQKQAIDSITRLLNSLLEISRLESGTLQLQSEHVSVGDVFDDLKNEFEPIAQGRNIELKISKTSLALNTDRSLFYQLIQNLVGNAIKYTDRGQVSIECQSRKPDAITVVVNDTGVGIPEEKLDRIFEEYYQIDGQTTNRVGVGLGLAIVRETSRLLEFSVEIASQVGVGTQVYVHIPKRFIAEEKQKNNSNHVSQQKTEQKPRVILVEDNDAVRSATEMFLKLEGYELLSATSATEVEQLMPRMTEGDVVITDYHLDGKMTGLQVLQAIRERLSTDVPAIVMSGDLPMLMLAVENTVPNCKFLSKPIDTNTLLSAIDTLSSKNLKN